MKTLSMILAVALGFFGGQQRAGVTVFQEGKRTVFVSAKTTTNSSSETTLIPTTQTNPALQNFVLQPSALIFSKIGTAIEVDMGGLLTTAASTPGTLTIKVKYGSTAIVTAATGTLPTSLTNAGWHAHLRVVLITLGASGTAACEGYLTLNNATVPIMLDLNTTSNQTVAQNAAGLFDVTGTCSGAVNSITTNPGGKIVVTDSL